MGKKKKRFHPLSFLVGLIKATFKLGRFLLGLAWRLATFTVEAALWLFLGVKSLFGFGRQLSRSARAAATGVVYCPDGHAIPIGTGDVVHSCSSCGFRYRGSPLVCPNPECEAPVAAYVDCPTCGLSVSSPFRSR